MGKNKPVWFGMKLTHEHKKQIKSPATRLSRSAKETVMRFVKQALAKDDLNAPDGSFLAGIEHLIGAVDGPVDLASNQKHLEGFGR
jgi:hypothetical protein